MIMMGKSIRQIWVNCGLCLNLFQLHFPKYLTSDVYYKYLSELVSTVQTGQDFPLGPRKRRGNNACMSQTIKKKVK